MASGISLLREIIESFTDAERKAADFILAKPKAAIFYTISELAKQSETSAPAIVRLCKKAGLSGYRELQMLIARDIYTSKDGEEQPLPDFQLDSGIRIEDLAKNSIERVKEAMDRLAAILNASAIEEAGTRISAARSIAVFGTGASGLVAYDLAQKLVRLGIPCSFSFDPHMQITAACGLTDKDVAFAVSYSGETQSVLVAVDEARKSGSIIVSITKMGGNSLAKRSDILLPIPATESLFRLGATLSRMTQLAVVDILYGALVSRNIDRAVPLIERSMQATHHL
jgi:DNA-binding MurR/RpiR family transcriptional regulator